MNKELTERYLKQELSYLFKYFDRFDSPQNKKITVDVFILNVPIPYIKINNFPLPDKFAPNDQETIIISLANYPDSPPNGIYVHKDSSKTLRLIEDSLDGHIHNKTYNSDHEMQKLEEHGWRWVCFHLKDNKWKYNLNNPIKGDCLYSYIKLLSAALDGNYQQ